MAVARSVRGGAAVNATLLIGRWEVSVDDKGRIVIPAAIRPRFAEGAVIVYKGDQLGLYPMSEYVPQAERLRTLVAESASSGMSAEDQKRLRAVSRTFFGTSNQCDLDSAGRVRLPKHEGFTELDRVTLNGEFTFLGIYAPDALDTDVALSADELSGELAKLGM